MAIATASAENSGGMRKPPLRLRPCKAGKSSSGRSGRRPSARMTAAVANAVAAAVSWMPSRSPSGWLRREVRPSQSGSAIAAITATAAAISAAPPTLGVGT